MIALIAGASGAAADRMLSSIGVVSPHAYPPTTATIRLRCRGLPSGPRPSRSVAVAPGRNDAVVDKGKAHARDVQDDEEFNRPDNAADEAHAVARKHFGEQAGVDTLGGGAANNQPGGRGDKSERTDHANGNPE